MAPDKCDWCHERVHKLFHDAVSLPEEEKFLEFLMDYHEVFSLEENERGETDKLQLHIETRCSPKEAVLPSHVVCCMRGSGSTSREDGGGRSPGFKQPMD